MHNNQHQQRHLTPSDLHELLEVDYESGKLRWKPRDVSMFSSKRSASIWNVRFAGKLALEAKHRSGYLNGGILSRLYLTHRVLLAMKHGEWPKYVDHINGDRADNRICNLRSVTRSQNGCNTKIPRTNTSGCIGVSWNARDKRWSAYITLGKKRKALGNFLELSDAVSCRKQAETALGFHHNHGRLV